MSRTLEELEGKRKNAVNLLSVVKTMKTLSSVTIGQFEESVHSLRKYYEVVERGLIAYLCTRKFGASFSSGVARTSPEPAARISILLGSDLGMVGRFNESLVDLFMKGYCRTGVDQRIVAVGERMSAALASANSPPSCVFRTPDCVEAMIPAVTDLLDSISLEHDRSPQDMEVMLFYSRMGRGTSYDTVVERILPLDELWLEELSRRPRVSNVVPDVIYEDEDILSSLIAEFLFVTLFKACSESVMCENAARLSYMEQAKGKIDDLLEELEFDIRQTRQTQINNELFDIISGFEAMRLEDETA